MKKPTKKDFGNHILKIVKKYKPKLFLERYEFFVAYPTEDARASFESVFRYPYLDARIRFSENAYKSFVGGDKQESQIVHEMCHVLTDYLYGVATERFASRTEMEAAREMLTDWIVRIVMAKQSS